MKRLNGKSAITAAVALIMILGAISFCATTGCAAGEEGKKEAVAFDVDTSMNDNLAALKGKTVTVTLSTGQTMTGTVSAVKGNLLHLSRISGKEFYDALIAIDRIAAIEMKAR